MELQAADVRELTIKCVGGKIIHSAQNHQNQHHNQ